MSKLRIAIGGIQHETNSFAPVLTRYADFDSTGSSPPILRGEALLAHDGAGALGGILRALRQSDAQILPLIWAEAQPGGIIERTAFDALTEGLFEALDQAGPLDAVVLDLHGAMVAQGTQDAEGWLLTELRQRLGPDCFIAAALDFHGNLSTQMVAQSDFLLSYRTYPHVDMAETGARVVEAALGWLARGQRPAKAFAQGDFLIPIHAQSTLIAPMTRLAALQRRAERDGAVSSFLPGFPPADVADCGPSILAYAQDQATADAALSVLRQGLHEAEADFAAIGLLDGPAAVAQALRPGAVSPAILVDTQDNPGAGASSDTTGMLRALLAVNAPDAVVAVLHDPQAAALAHEKGVAAHFDLAFGGSGDQPWRGEVTVEALGDGSFAGTGGYYNGNPLNFGPMALLRLRGSGVQVIVGSVRAQAGTRAIFHHLGLDPAKIAVIGLKSSVHFMADFAEVAGEVIYAAFPGLNRADPSEFPYQNLRPGLRLKPQA
ncbi:M81 family metallopeptidase [Xinfangfangia sp. CPCC 101601]|uniref:Microcystinase C n=1 Tax=Pseudogemmobacter lacusdianii TaxID=3069608 RepID=A0ABU0VVX1_9RHOB|nr:M81 family metallopeptidase [Xinfangfangia sp. CPCC 101601]MDQ2065906.1 M81 family metallopeptidase [Xinfangfangia sp. CPCC 101601]